MGYIQIVTPTHKQKKKMLETEGKSLSLKRQHNLSDLNLTDLTTAPRAHVRTKRLKLKSL